MVCNIFKHQIERFIKTFIEYSPYLIILSIIDLIFGGLIIFLLEEGRLCFFQSYWIHTYAFFGNEPSNLYSPFSKLLMISSSFLGLIVLPAVFGVMINYYQKRMELEEDIKNRLRILLMRNNPTMGISAVDDQVNNIFRSIEKDLENFKRH